MTGDFKRKFMEAIQITKHPHNINFEGGQSISHSWLPVTKVLPKHKSNC